jgi:hypothetical protein
MFPVGWFLGVRDHRRETESEVSATVLRRYKNAVSLALPSVMAWGAEEEAALLAAEPAARTELLRMLAFDGMGWLLRRASVRAELADAARAALPPAPESGFVGVAYARGSGCWTWLVHDGGVKQKGKEATADDAARKRDACLRFHNLAGDSLLQRLSKRREGKPDIAFTSARAARPLRSSQPPPPRAAAPLTSAPAKRRALLRTSGRGTRCQKAGPKPRQPSGAPFVATRCAPRLRARRARFHVQLRRFAAASRCGTGRSGQPQAAVNAELQLRRATGVRHGRVLKLASVSSGGC